MIKKTNNVTQGKYADFRFTKLATILAVTYGIGMHIYTTIFGVIFFNKHKNEIKGVETSYFGLMRDNYDPQLKSFISGFPAVGLLMVFHLLSSYAIKKATDNYKSLTIFNFIIGFIFMVVLYGPYSIHCTLVLLINFLISRLTTIKASNRFVPILTWGFNLSIFWLNFGLEGIKFKDISPSIAYLDTAFSKQMEWENHFRLLILKLISFNIDYYNSYKEQLIVNSPKKTIKRSPVLNDYSKINITEDTKNDHCNSTKTLVSSTANITQAESTVSPLSTSLKERQKKISTMFNNSNANFVLNPQSQKSVATNYQLLNSMEIDNIISTDKDVQIEVTDTFHNNIHNTNYHNNNNHLINNNNTNYILNNHIHTNNNINTCSAGNSSVRENTDVVSEINPQEDKVLLEEKKIENDITLSQRIKTNHPLQVYNFINYMSYCLYCPLFLAGPTLPFNGYISQLISPNTSIKLLDTLKYGLRIIINYIVLEVYIHFIFANALYNNEDNWKLWNELGAGYLFPMGLYALMFIWLKFLLIWRFARFWTLLNGIDCTENMHRCVFNTYSIERFWRCWHQSFNTWIIRYIYIPLGGNKNKILLSFIVFFFVGLWHDFTLTMIGWAIFFSVGLCFETLFRSLGENKAGLKWIIQLQNYKMYIFICVFLNFISTSILIAGNLVGFSFKYYGLSECFKVAGEEKNGYFKFFFGMFWITLATCIFAVNKRDREDYKNKT